MKIAQYPLFKITALYCTGLCTGFYYNPSLRFSICLLAISFIICFLLYLQAFKNFQQTVFLGISVCMLAFSIGITSQALHNPYNQPGHYITHLDKFPTHNHVEVRIQEKLKNTATYQRYIASVYRINTQDYHGKLLIQIRRTIPERSLSIGSRIKIHGQIQQFHIPFNPHQFDYRSYMEHKGILGYMKINPNAVVLCNIKTKNSHYYSAEFRNTILTNLKNSGFAPAALEVVAALLLGQKQDMDPTILQDYRLAGAVHILSVSGLHIGLIYFFISSLLQFLPNTRYSLFIKTGIVILTLWLFAMIAGGSPSVVRSVVMFTFAAIAALLRRGTSIYHTLIVSALLMLLWDPATLFDVGFQLSYSALFFIVWLQPALSGFWTPKFKILRYLWDILTVSIAAQIGTLPLSLYYFHQFPGLFFLTNIIVLPLLTIIMIYGLIVLLLAALDITHATVSKLLEIAISALNSIIHKIASYDDFIFRDVPCSLPVMLSLYSCVIAIVLWLKKPTFPRLLILCSFVIITQLTCWMSRIQSTGTADFIVLHSYKNPLLLERQGNKITVFSNRDRKDILQDSSLKPYQIATHSHIDTLLPLRNLYYFQHQKILILDQHGILPEHCDPDIIILSQSPKINLERLLKKVQPKLIIADATNYNTTVQLWKRTCSNAKIPFHAIAEKGFYRINN
ncbi:ComEC/Rec2 family competence protein [Flavobacterium kingsejongi]|uniref:Competence protein ComEC n=1 Tax=Flavobacterium kingsejongi TaxID=1678728 RepID=A0A2S1LN76_9FLAO|nr:ComEC/Rec2 family competence protein [Flavobacterium kingsejongi]AWG25121.1 hypothetical protein FK004_07680 [Flavobacterium kingsejongi]